ncbi:MAG: hypothetical protein V4557_01430 [Bacteroidota bacterium]
MNTAPHITASCSISENTVRKNGQVLYSLAGKEPMDLFVGIYQHYALEYPRFYKMDSLAKLGWLTSEILLKESFDANAYEPEQTGLILCNANASLDTDIKYLATTNEIASPSVFVYTLPNIMTGEISIRNRFKGENAFFISESFDAAFLQQYVSGLLNQDILQACICGWVELLDKEYKAVLFLVEKKETPGAVLFSAENMNELFYQKEASNG